MEQNYEQEVICHLGHTEETLGIILSDQGEWEKKGVKRKV